MFTESEEQRNLLDDEHSDMQELYSKISDDFDHHELIFEAEASFSKYKKEFNDDQCSIETFFAKVKFEDLAYDILESDK